MSKSTKKDSKMTILVYIWSFLGLKLISLEELKISTFIEKQEKD